MEPRKNDIEKIEDILTDINRYWCYSDKQVNIYDPLVWENDTNPIHEWKEHGHNIPVSDFIFIPQT